MLSQKTLGATVAVALTIPAGLHGGPIGTQCPPYALTCDVYSAGTTTAHPGPAVQNSVQEPSSGGQSTSCRMGDKTVPCQLSDGSWFNSSDKCYWKRETNPDPKDAAWDGHRPGEGALYDVNCPNVPGVNRQLQGGTVWAADPPPGQGGGPNLQALAQQAVSHMTLLGPDIGMAPDPNGRGGTVGVPVWMWNRPGPRRTGPASASASAGGVTVTATATVRKVLWSMGDGTTVACAGPGTPYQASYGMRQSPDCGHLYQSTSARQPGGKYTVTATSVWAVHWIGAGQQGDLTTTRTSQVRVTVGELQVVGD